MKKILFIIPEYSFGGTNKSLQNLLNLLDETKYKVSVFCLYEDGGKYYKEVFKKYVLKKGIIYYLLHDNFLTRKFLGLYKFFNKKDKCHWLYKHEAHRISCKYNFDIIVSYQELLATEFATYCKSAKKIAWVQCDYPILIGNRRYNEDAEYYQQYNSIVCVSKNAAHSMREFFPKISVPFDYVYNTLDIDYIKAKSLSFKSEFDKQAFNIVSIGRVTKVKGFAYIPKMANELKQKISKTFRWYIIGSGEDMNLLRELIIQLNLQDVVVLLGYTDNPYPYIKDADLYVCTSESESFSYTIAESKVLHTPVLSNDFPVAFEVVSEKEGWITSNSQMVPLLAKIILDENNIYSKMKKNIQSYNYDNAKILKKIDELFG